MRLHKVPTLLASIHIAQHGADDERCILRTDLAVECLRQGPVEERGLCEGCQREKVAAFLLWCASRLKSLSKFIITCGIAGEGEDRDEGRKEIRIDRCLILSRDRVEFLGTRLSCRIISKPSECTDQFAAELSGEVALPRSCDPSDGCCGWTDPIAHKSLKCGAVRGFDNAVQEGE